MSNISNASKKKKKVVIIGGVAGGATAAARLHRLDDALQVTVLEKSTDVSVAACGEPYFLSRTIESDKKLALQTADSLSKVLRVDVRTSHNVVGIDRAKKTVTCENGAVFEYDKLLLSPGARPVVPPIPGVFEPGTRKPVDGIFVLHSLKDMRYIDAFFRRSAKCIGSVCVIGAGFVGLEVVENLRDAAFKDSLGREVRKEVTLIEAGDTVMPPADDEIGALLAEPILEAGVALHTGVNVDKIVRMLPQDDANAVQMEAGASCPMFEIHITHRATKKRDVVRCNMIVAATGVAPNSELAKECGLAVGRRGHVRVNQYLQSISDPDVYAAGDVIEAPDFVFPSTFCNFALGNLANQQARVAADHISACLSDPDTSRHVGGAPFSLSSSSSSSSGGSKHSKPVPYPGNLGTFIVKIFDWAFACTGWSERRLRMLRPQTKYQVVTITGPDHAEYYPGAHKIVLKVIFDPDTGKILGAQATGAANSGVDKRIDVMATAMFGGLSINDVATLQLCYSPVFGSARDVVNTAGLAARNIRHGLFVPQRRLFGKSDHLAASAKKKVVTIDVRLTRETDERPVPGALRIPFPELEARLPSLDKEHTRYRLVCLIGRASYFAARLMAQRGFVAESVMGGATLVWRPPLAGQQQQQQQQQQQSHL